jgi:YD repeat-containing protein
LQAFVDARADRRALGQLADEAADVQAAAAAGCGMYAPEVGAIGAVSQWCWGPGSRNESWVATIREQLLAADVMGSGGVVTVDAARVVQALRDAGVGQRPAVVEVPWSTSLGVPQTSGFADDPVCLFNGNFVHTEVDVTLPGLAGPLQVVRTYNSLATDRLGAFGAGWTSPLDVHVTVVDGSAYVTLADGAVAVCDVAALDGVGCVLPGRSNLRLFADADGLRLVDSDTGHVWRFDAAGRLAAGEVGASRLRFERDGAGRVVRIVESVTGRWVGYDWVEHAGAWVVSAARSSDDRRVGYRYAPDVTTLVGVDAPAGSFDYDVVGGLIGSIIDADGVVIVSNTYDPTGRVTSQRSRHGRTTVYTYDRVSTQRLPGHVDQDLRDGYRTVVAGDDGTAMLMIHNANGELLEMVDATGMPQRFVWADGHRAAVIDRRGNVTRFGYDDAGRVAQRIDPDGLATGFVWDDRGRLVERTDRAGNTTRFVFDTDFDTPTAVVNPDGSVATLRLDDRGLVAEAIDADGVATWFEWDSDGELVGVRNTAGTLGEIMRDAHGDVVGTVDAGGVQVRLVLDAAGRITEVHRAGAVSTVAYSAAGRGVSGVEPEGVSWRNTFGAAGELAAVTDAEGSTVTFGYDTCGHQVAVTAPDGTVFEQHFDPIGRLVGTTDPDGNTTAARYDHEGAVIEMIDAAGNSWRRDVDTLGRTIATTDPTGATTTCRLHPNGEIATVTLADGRRWVHDIDSFGRTVSVRRPDGQVATVEYTPGGRLRRRTSPAGRVEEFEYDTVGACVAVIVDGERVGFDVDACGRVTAIVGGVNDGTRIEWGPNGPVEVADVFGARSFDYGTAGRLASITDATGVARRFGYDARGLLANVVDATDTSSALSYDQRGRLTGVAHAGNRRVAYGYDRVGRLSSVTDNDVVTSIERDANGRIASCVDATGGAGSRMRYDAAGRITNLADGDGATIAEYRYDATGRLVLVTEPGENGRLGVERGLTWDDNDLLVADISPKAGMRVERDADGWVNALVQTDADGAVSRVELSRDRFGQVVQTRRDGNVIDDLMRRERDVAGRYVTDRAGRVIEYDLAGRVAVIHGTDGDIMHRYNADGLLAAIESPSGEVRYRHDAAGRVVETISPNRTVSHVYDPAGRRVRDVIDHPDCAGGHDVVYRWDRTGRLAEIVTTNCDATTNTVTVSYDAFGSPIVADSRGDAVGVTDPFTAAIWIDRLAVYPNRSYDQLTGQWLSPDPLATPPGTPGSASAHTFNYLDAINFVDPTGLKPLTDAEFQQWKTDYNQGAIAGAVDIVPDWVFTGVVVAAGVGLCFTPFAVVGAGILIGAATSTAVGAATGTLTWDSVTMGGIIGGAGALTGMGVATAVSRASMATRITATALGDATFDAGVEYTQTGRITPTNTLISLATGTTAASIGETLAIRHTLNTTPAPGLTPSNGTAHPINTLAPRGTPNDTANVLPSSGKTYVGTPRGTVYDVPESWAPRVADNGKGIVYQKPGAVGNTNSVRIMEPTPKYPDGYARVYNGEGNGQPIDVFGQPGPQPATHIPETYQGPWPGWPQ